jgi:cytochrome bd-type quinol oxidase subunit 2
MTTYDPYAQTADPAETRGRAVAGAAAWAAMLLAIAAGVAGLPDAGRELTGRAWAGIVLALLALLCGVGSIRHGSRHEHERGRLAAGVAVFVAGVVLPLILAVRFGIVAPL